MLTEELSQNYTTILKEELVAAMGCTEPIAIAYAAAKAYRELGEMPDHIRISCSGNIIKNVKGVTVPNSGGQKGIETAAVLGVVGGDSAISQEGLDNPWGARVGKTMLENWSGAVSAACGAGAGITYMSGGTYEQIGGTITNTLGNVGGIVCDGAKPSCAAKIASSVHAALLAHYMSVSQKEFLGGEGFIESDVEKTIKNMGYIGKIGMKQTDREILNVMIDKVDVDSCL